MAQKVDSKGINIFFFLHPRSTGPNRMLIKTNVRTICQLQKLAYKTDNM